MVSTTVFQNIYHILSAAWRRRYLIVFPLLLMPIVGLGIGMLTPKNYVTHMSFLLQETAKMNPFLEDLAVSTNLKERMAGLKTLLHSRHLLKLVAQDLNLINLDSSESDIEAKISKLSSALTVQLVGSDLIKLTYKSDQVQGMKDTLDIVGKRFIETLLAPEQSSIAASETFLTEQLDVIKAELSTSEKRLSTYKSDYALELPELHMSNIQQLRDTRQRLAQKNIELAGAKAGLSELKSKIGQLDPVIGRLEEQIISVRSELTMLRARYKDKHSDVQSAVRRLEHLESERNRIMNAAPSFQNLDMDRLWNMATTLNNGDALNQVQPLLVSQLQELQLAQTRYKSLDQEVISLNESVDDMDKRIAAFGFHEKNMKDMQRDLSVKQKLYEDLLKRYEMAKVTGALGKFESPERVKLIDRPFNPSSPINLPIILFVVAGLAGGGLLGVGMAVLVEASDNTVRRSETLQNLSGVPVLSRIPNITEEQFYSMQHLTTVVKQ